MLLSTSAVLVLCCHDVSGSRNSNRTGASSRRNQQHPRVDRNASGRMEPMEQASETFDHHIAKGGQGASKHGVRIQRGRHITRCQS